jgi:cytoskeletal protein CcmA (bactofilin family)
MMEDLVLNGSSKVGGGSYNQVVMNGSGTVEEDLECMLLECNGAGKVNGNAVTKDALFKGSTRIAGDLHSKNVHVQGHASIKGNLVAQQVEFRGAVSIGHSIRADQVNIDGLTKIGHDCESERVQVSGSFQIQGLLNADFIDVSLQGKSFAKEIGGETITVKRKNNLSLFDKVWNAFSNSLQADLIEGDHIYLEYTKAKIIRGSTITLGPGCEVERVEYKQEFHADKSSKIKEALKTT